MTRTGRLLAAAATVAALSACQTAREQGAVVKPEVVHAYLADKPVDLKTHFFVKMSQGKRNDVLNDMRIGLAAMEMGQDRLAEELFDEALTNIEAVYANNEHAAKARSLFVKEAVKDFKGEPYERAMAYYYRGLLYLKAGDYDNARASFKGGWIQDSFAEEEQYGADFGLLAYLQGWASRCRGNTGTADEDFKEFQAINGSFPLPKPEDNVLLLVETGSAPVKFSVAQEGGTIPRFLKMRRASATEAAQVILAETKGAAPPLKKGEPAPPQTVSRIVKAELLEDIYHQSATRGGRQFDSILDGKAQFKEGFDTAGNVMVVAGAAALAYTADTQGRGQTNQSDGAVAVAGLGLVMAGLISKGVAAATEAEADIRYWDTLPDRVHGLPLSLPDGVSSLPVEFLDNDGVVVRTKTAPVVRAGACGLAWVRGESAFPWSPRAPYSAPSETMATPVDIPPLPEPAKAEPTEKTDKDRET